MTEPTNDSTEANGIDELSLADQMTPEQLSMPGAIEAIVSEIKARAALSVQYKEAIGTATTETKREYFTKKLHKNNNIAADMVVALEQFIAAQQEQSADSGE